MVTERIDGGKKRPNNFITQRRESVNDIRLVHVAHAWSPFLPQRRVVPKV